MGFRLELPVILVILAIVFASVMIRLSPEASPVKTSEKELEFTDTIITEVNRTAAQGIAFSVYGVREKGELYLHNIVYHNQEIEMFSADRARYSNDMIYLDGNIKVRHEKGFSYLAQKAVYDQTAKLLEVTSDFTGTMDKNVVRGKYLLYDFNEKLTYGKKIDSVIYTASDR